MLQLSSLSLRQTKKAVKVAVAVAVTATATATVVTVAAEGNRVLEEGKHLMAPGIHAAELRHLCC